MPRKPKQFESFPASYSEATSVLTHRAVCEHVVDGDTIDVFMDLGWYQYAYEAVRFFGINAPETRGSTGLRRELGVAALTRTKGLLLNRPILVRSFKQRKSFERFLAHVYFAEGEQQSFSGAASITTGSTVWRLVSDVLVAEGLAEKT